MKFYFAVFSWRPALLIKSRHFLIFTAFSAKNCELSLKLILVAPRFDRKIGAC
jgi:hypothetical protein